MSVATIASVVAIAGTAYGAYSTSQNNKRAKAAAAGGGDVSGLIDDYDASAVFGTKPKAAEFVNKAYNPVDYGEVQNKTINDNLGSLPDILKLITQINSINRADSALRVETFAPGFGQNLRTMTDSARALVGGQLPYQDVLDIVSDRQELGNTLGTAGTYGAATLKDFGLSRLQAMQTGAEMMSRIGNLIESIDPVASRSRAQDFTLSPTQTVPLAQADAQFGASYDQMERILKQQSEQNKYLLEAAPDPAERGMFGAEFAARTGQPVDAAGGGGGWASSVNWGQLASQIYGAYRSTQTGSGGTTQQAPATTERYNPDSNWGYSAGDWDAGASGATGQSTAYWDGTY